MKKTVILLFVLSSTLNTFAQIRIGTTNEKTANKNIKYDSLYNYPYDKLYALIGQELYIVPNTFYKRIGFTSFYKEPKYQALKYKTKKKYDETKYEYLADKTFYVSNIIERKTEPGEIDINITRMPKGYKYYIELKEVENENNIAYFEYSCSPDMYPFVCVGYFEKMKKKYIGTSYYYKNNLLSINDYNSGEQFIPSPQSEWVCEDVILDSKDFKLKLLFKNKNKQSFIDIDKCIYSYMIPKDLGDSYKKLYGDFYDAAMNHEIKIGMNKIMVEFAWGEPDKINPSNIQGEYNEQWVYNKACLYFNKEGKLESYN